MSFVKSYDKCSLMSSSILSVEFSILWQILTNKRGKLYYMLFICYCYTILLHTMMNQEWLYLYKEKNWPTQNYCWDLVLGPCRIILEFILRPCWPFCIYLPIFASFWSKIPFFKSLGIIWYDELFCIYMYIFIFIFNVITVLIWFYKLLFELKYFPQISHLSYDFTNDILNWRFYPQRSHC